MDFTAMSGGGKECSRVSKFSSAHGRFGMQGRPRRALGAQQALTPCMLAQIRMLSAKNNLPGCCGATSEARNSWPSAQPEGVSSHKYMRTPRRDPPYVSSVTEPSNVDVNTSVPRSNPSGAVTVSQFFLSMYHRCYTYRSCSKSY